MKEGTKLVRRSVTIEKLELQGFRAYLHPQTFTLASGKTPLSLALFGPNAKGKSSLVDSFEYYFSEDATLKRLGKRAVQTHAGRTAIAHVEAQESGIDSSVHFWFRRNGAKFDAERPSASPMPEAAKRVLSTIKVPFVIRGHDLRSFVEETTPGDRYKELASWFGLDPLLLIQQNLRALRRKVKGRADATAGADERSRDLSRATGGEIASWDDQAVCDWLNNEVFASLDSSLTFTGVSEQDPAFAVLIARRDAEQEKLGLTQLRRISGLLEDLATPLDGTDMEPGGKLPGFEKAVSRLNEAVLQEEKERTNASAAVFSQVWTEAKKVFDSDIVLHICPVCDTSLATGPHGSPDGVQASLAGKLAELATYRKADEELTASKKRIDLLVELLKNSVEAVKVTLTDTVFDCAEVADYSRALGRWNIDEELPGSREVVSALSRAYTAIAGQIMQIEAQQGEHTYAKAHETVTTLLRFKADRERIARTKAQLGLLQIELARQVWEIDKVIVGHIHSLIGKLQKRCCIHLPGHPGRWLVIATNSHPTPGPGWT